MESSRVGSVVSASGFLGWGFKVLGPRGWDLKIQVFWCFLGWGFKQIWVKLATVLQIRVSLGLGF